MYYVNLKLSGMHEPNTKNPFTDRLITYVIEYTRNIFINTRKIFWESKSFHLHVIL